MARKSFTIWEAHRARDSVRYALRADGKLLIRRYDSWTIYERQPVDMDAAKQRLIDQGYTVKETPEAKYEYERQQRQRKARGSRRRL